MQGRLTLRRLDSQTAVQDDLIYEYNIGTNRLRNTNAADGENYVYDEIGNLVSDADEGIDNIIWTPYGKVRAVIKDDNSEVRFRYDASGNRIAKIASGDTTVYVRDASGNVMAIYRNDTLVEQSIYGSSRLGLITASSKTGYRTLGGKKYELSNHLGNVLAVVTDNIHLDQDSTWATVINTTDYYPFGLAMDGRTVQDSSYRYLYNGNEILNDHGLNLYDFKSRHYDPVTGRFWSVDVLADHPRQIGMSPYSAFWNNPIRYNDPDGRCPECVAGEDVVNAMVTDFLTVKHSAYNLLTRFFGYEATFVDSESGGYRTGFVETNDGYLATVGKTALDVLTVGTFGRGGGPTGGLFAKTGGWGINSTIREVAKSWSGIMSTRFKIADNFYRKSGFSDYDDHLAGIDFQSPVSVQTLKKGTVVEQWVREGGEVGSYFARPGADPAKLGISTEGRVRKTFELTEDMKVLKSSTQDIGGHTGGGTQFFSPQLKDVLKQTGN